MNRVFANYVYLCANKIIERTMSGFVTAIQKLDASRLRDNNLSAQIDLLCNGQKEQNQVIQELRKEIAEMRPNEMRNEEKNKNKGSKIQENVTRLSTWTGKTANDDKRAHTKKVPKPGN